jgi:hypothetical protein
VHCQQHRHAGVSVVEDLNLPFRRVDAVEATGVLLNRAAPGHEQSKEQRVETGIVEPLADIAAGYERHSGLLVGDRLQRRFDLLPFPGAQFAGSLRALMGTRNIEATIPGVGNSVPRNYLSYLPELRAKSGWLVQLRSGANRDY